MSFHIIIPARLQATRLPGKLLIEIQGKSILQRVYEQCCRAQALSLTIATDSQDIVNHAHGFGADVILTDPQHPSGTDRVAEAARILDLASDAVIVNVQGDEPEMRFELIQQVAAGLGHADCSSLYWPITTLEEFFNPHVVKVVMDQQWRARYFSRAPIPYYREQPNRLPTAYRHLGLYAYRMDSLQTWVNSPAVALELFESLEQLRALSLGMTIQMQQAHHQPGQDINTLEDVRKYQTYLEKL